MGSYLKIIEQKTKKIVYHRMLHAACILSLLISSCLTANIVEVLQKHKATTLVDLAVKAGLADTLIGDGPFTVFAPSNDAFSALPSDLVDTLMQDTELLKKVLLYHVVSGEVPSNAASNNIKLDSVEGAPLLVNLYLKSKYYNGFITINGKRVTNADNKADNGLVHFIDGVMMIPQGDLVDVLAADPKFSTLVTAVKEAGLVDTVKAADAFTIFAPTNEAFAKVPEDTLNSLLADKEALSAVLLRHVAPGYLYSKGIMWAELETAGGEMIASQVFRKGVVKVVSSNDGSRTVARVVDTDITATNGVIHAIDTVI